jgi:hypothetical protein
MKIKISLSILLVLLTAAFVINPASNLNTKTETNSNKGVLNVLPPPPTSGEFLIGAMNSYDSSSLSVYDSAGLNITHFYNSTEWNSSLGRNTPISGLTGEHLTDAVPTAAIYNIMQNIDNHRHSRFLWQRPKIEWLCYGKSSTYQAEEISLNDDLWFYAFQTHVGESVPDYEHNNGNYVLHCGMPTDNAGIVLQKLKANTEQCVIISGFNQWQGSSESRWIIKPRIRIDSTVAHNPSNPVVCNIKVYDQYGTGVLKNVDIHAINFLDNDGYYNGRYLEEYFFGQNDSTLAIKGAWGDNWGWSARGNNTNEDSVKNHADIQLYWYDNCDIWIDYIKVEDDVASDLLTDNHSNANWILYNQWIQQEVDAVKDPISGTEPPVYDFYIEIPKFNNIPCMAYVNKKIQWYSGNKIGMMAEVPL